MSSHVTAPGCAEGPSSTGARSAKADQSEIDTQSADALPPSPAAEYSRQRGAIRYLGVILAAVIPADWLHRCIPRGRHWDAQVAESSFVDRARRHEQTLNVHLSNAAGVLYTLKAYFEFTAHSIGADEYESFSRSLRERFVGLRDTGWSPRVTRNERAAFERSIQGAGFPRFSDHRTECRRQTGPRPGARLSIFHHLL